MLSVEQEQVSEEARQEFAERPEQSEQKEQTNFRLFLLRVDAGAQQMWVWLLGRRFLRQSLLRSGEGREFLTDALG